MKIVIDPFDMKSIDKALKQIREYEREFEAKEREFVKRLAEIGVSVASTGFQLADYDGEKDVVVSMNQNGTEATVIASGETVGFIEFGTGVLNPEWSGSAETGHKPPAHGTYGKGLGKNPHGWYFKQGEGTKARHTFGNAPAEAMLTARDKMIEQVTRIAREVWK